MPEISRFFGIIIAMFYNDHAPPHFHARHGRDKALFEIETLPIIEGDLPSRVAALVREWANLHRDELRHDWELARRHEPLKQIEPLEQPMLVDVIDVSPLSGYRLWLRFEDQKEGEVDVSKLVEFSGVFAALKDHPTFEAVRVDPDLGTVVWPGGADLDPSVLYSLATGAPLPAEPVRHAE